jgi:hypothetical protein
MLPACSSTADFSRLNPVLFTDDIHAWVGEEAAASAGASISGNNLTDDERTLRDLAFPLIEPPYDRLHWDAVVYEYGTKRSFQRKLWVHDPTAYYQHLQSADRRHPQRRGARRAVLHDGAPGRRSRSPARSQHAAGRPLSPPERLSALARVGENTLTIAWVQHSLVERCAGYRFALEHLAVAEPAAADADRALRELQQAIDGSRITVSAPRFAPVPAVVAAR